LHSSDDKDLKDLGADPMHGTSGNGDGGEEKDTLARWRQVAKTMLTHDRQAMMCAMYDMVEQT